MADYVTEWSCTYEHEEFIGSLDAYPFITSSDCIAVATTSSATSTTDFGYSDTLFVSLTLIFLVSFIAWGLLSSIFKPRS